MVTVYGLIWSGLWLMFALFECVVNFFFFFLPVSS